MRRRFLSWLFAVACGFAGTSWAVENHNSSYLKQLEKRLVQKIRQNNYESVVDLCRKSIYSDEKNLGKDTIQIYMHLIDAYIVLSNLGTAFDTLEEAARYCNIMYDRTKDIEYKKKASEFLDLIKKERENTGDEVIIFLESDLRKQAHNDSRRRRRW
ncbi:MAG: hypothetical protein AAF310_04070 [Myxococcota bacterium]